MAQYDELPVYKATYNIIRITLKMLSKNIEMIREINESLIHLLCVSSFAISTRHDSIQKLQKSLRIEKPY
jgi:hypothetical protein